MLKVFRTREFMEWLTGLRDLEAAHRVAVRLKRVESGLLGDVKPVGGGVSELRIDYGPGYRIYFQQRGPVLILLLCGGDKGSQSHDIKRAKEIAKGTANNPAWESG
jgi:putative addiction module killer protein